MGQNKQIQWATELCDAFNNDPDVGGSLHRIDLLDMLAKTGLRLEIDSQGEVDDAYEELVNRMINEHFITLRFEDQDDDLEL
jgi:hypothetical protein